MRRARKMAGLAAPTLLPQSGMLLVSLVLSSSTRLALAVDGNDVFITYDPSFDHLCVAPDDPTDDDLVPSGRTFEGGMAPSADCPSGKGWIMTATLNPDAARKITILSCKEDEVLRISLEGGGVPINSAPGLTADDKNFFAKFASSAAQGGNISSPHNSYSIEFQAINAARLLAEWPDDEPVQYVLDALAQAGIQPSTTAIDLRFSDPPDAGGIPQPEGAAPTHEHTRPPRRLYTSLCPDLTRYINGLNRQISLNARIGHDTSCGARRMAIFEKTDGANGVCIDVPGTIADNYDGGWATGDCFGRCGVGCGGSSKLGDGTYMSQYTLDCADLDFCLRFGFGDYVSGGSCGTHFRNAVDDWMWSGNCDFEAKDEINSDNCGGGDEPDVIGSGPGQQNAPGTGHGRPTYSAPSQGTGGVAGAGNGSTTSPTPAQGTGGVVIPKDELPTFATPTQGEVDSQEPFSLPESPTPTHSPLIYPEDTIPVDPTPNHLVPSQLDPVDDAERILIGKAPEEEDCVDGHTIVFILDEENARHLTVLSCREEEKLKICLTVDGEPILTTPGFTPDDILILREIAQDLATLGTLDPNSVSEPVNIAINTARLAANWPSGVPVCYELDPAQQRKLQMSRGNPNSKLHAPSNPSLPQPYYPIPEHIHVAGRLYTSLCPDLFQYLEGQGSDGRKVKYRIDDNGPCRGTADAGIELWDVKGDKGRCLRVPFLPPGYEDGWATGNCFGRCSTGCGDGSDDLPDYGMHMSQYTYDCAALDYCNILGFGKDHTGGTACAQQFLDAVDDWLWSGNCDFQQRAEIIPNKPSLRSAAGTEKLSPKDSYRLGLEVVKDSLRALLGKDHRTYDGRGNNLDHPEWGSSNTTQIRRSEPAYQDNGAVSDIMSGSNRPNARVISNDLLRTDEDEGRMKKVNTHGTANMLWQWGQFIDHDFTHSVTNNMERANIPIPADDDMLDPEGTGRKLIPFRRTESIIDENGVRQQINHVTSYIDASMVYGSDEDRASALRSFKDGKLVSSLGNFMPLNLNGLANSVDQRKDFYLAGDERSNENVGLTSIHTIFFREHNLCAETVGDIFRSEGTELSDEQLFQLCRRIVGAIIQSITYKEFLPQILGSKALPPYAGYDDTVNAGAINEFGVVGFRLGHLLLPSHIELLDADLKVPESGPILLHTAFHNPKLFVESGIDNILRGLVSQRCHNVEPLLVEDVRSMLFGDPGRGGMDLAALNIQRGRDHGLPSYNGVREGFGLPPAVTFADITSDPVVAEKLEALYGNVDDVDPWVGAICEDHYGNAMVGSTMYHIVREQFINFRDGDRFWYEEDFGGVSPALVAFIDQQMLSNVILRNTDIKVGQIPAYAMTQAWMSLEF